MIEIVTAGEAEPLLDWVELADVLEAGHSLPEAQVGDQLLLRGTDTILSRAAVVDGLGIAVKTGTIFPSNAESGIPTINGAVVLFSDQTGMAEAFLDFRLVTRWKTAGDSLLAARHLARPDSRQILIVGAGTVARSMVEALSTCFPDARFLVWNRTEARARQLVDEMASRYRIEVASDLEAAVREAEVISCATMSCDPLIEGDWLVPGTHLDLIGAYRPDMREADDRAMQRSRVFVDSRKTTIGHIGEITRPLEQGVIRHSDIIADFYDLPRGKFRRTSNDEITLFKNGGGAHLDLMTARYILDRWKQR